MSNQKTIICLHGVQIGFQFKSDEGINYKIDNACSPERRGFAQLLSLTENLYKMIKFVPSNS